VFANFATPTVRHAVQAQAVSVKIDGFQEPALKILHLRKIDSALEDRFLDALPDALAKASHSSQTPTPRSIFSAHVVANDDQHDEQTPHPQRIANDT
jgi:hypothetical protein